MQARSIEVDAADVGIVDFEVDDAREQALYNSGRTAAEAFLSTWDFEAYKARFRPPAT